MQLFSNESRRRVVIEFVFVLSVVCCLALMAVDAVSAPDGWAVVDALGVESTTGGGDGQIVTARTDAELRDFAGRAEPLVIRIEGTLTGTGEKIDVASNKTFIGAGPDATLTKNGLNMLNVSNIIIRNLTITLCLDGIALRGTHHVWIDHCDLSASGDGLIDITKASDFVTVSWCRFSNHNKASLVNSGTSEPADEGRLNCTYHHCWWDGSLTRNPRVGYGKVHVYDCLYNGNNYCIGTHSQARILAENNYFDQTDNVVQQMYVSDPNNPFFGHCEERGSIFNLTTGVNEADGISFAAGDYYLHDFLLEPAADVPQSVPAGAITAAAYGAITPLPIPGNGAINVAIGKQPTWTSAEAALSYDLYFGTTNPPALISNTTNQSYSPGGLNPNTIYYWRVDTVTSSTTLEGEVWRFRTLPAKAYFPGPANGETNVVITQDLSWRAGAEALMHKVYFGAQNPPPFIADRAVTNYDPGTLDFGQTYYWRIDEVTAGGTIAGDVWQFETAGSVKAGPGRVEAENMLLQNGYFSQSFPAASGGKVAGIDGTNGAISYFHQGVDGNYELIVTYYDEDDGASPYQLYIGGLLADQWTANANPPGSGFRSRTIPSVPIDFGAEIRVIGSRQADELARIDYVETRQLESPQPHAWVIE